MKLKDLLIDIINEANIVKVPDEAMGVAEKAFDYIKKNINDITDKAPLRYDKPYIPSNFLHAIKLKDLSGKDIKVSIGFYNDPKDFGAGRMNTRTDTVLLNLTYITNTDKDTFLDLIEHELVHAMDPKIRDIELFGREYAKKGAEPSGSKFVLSKSNPNDKSPYDKSYDKYLKSPWEFDAYSSPLVKVIEKSYNKFGDNNEFKNKVKNDLMKLFSAIKDKSVKEIMADPELKNTAWYLSSKPWEEDKYDLILADFEMALKAIKAWSTKPTLYKKFLQRVSSVIK